MLDPVKNFAYINMTFVCNFSLCTLLIAQKGLLNLNGFKIL